MKDRDLHISNVHALDNWKIIWTSRKKPRAFYIMFLNYSFSQFVFLLMTMSSVWNSSLWIFFNLLQITSYIASFRLDSLHCSIHFTACCTVNHRNSKFHLKLDSTKLVGFIWSHNLPGPGCMKQTEPLTVDPEMISKWQNLHKPIK